MPRKYRSPEILEMLADAYVADLGLERTRLTRCISQTTDCWPERNRNSHSHDAIVKGWKRSFLANKEKLLWKANEKRRRQQRLDSYRSMGEAAERIGSQNLLNLKIVQQQAKAFRDNGNSIEAAQQAAKRFRRTLNH